jgi:glycine hydroxymethyltransferase
MNPRDHADFVYEQVQDHHAWFDRSIPMIASENIISPTARRLLVSDFHDRYAEGHPGDRYYQGLPYVDEVERRCKELARELVGVPWVDVRPIAGTNANQAAFFATCEPGDTVTACGTAAGGHISHATIGAAGVRGLDVETYPFDGDAMNLPPDATADLIRATEPDLCLFGRSVWLFPTPLEDGIADAAKEVGATIMYDAAHVLGLVAAGRFQSPLEEGADFVTGSTHKTLPGPQGGILYGDFPEEDLEERGTLARRLDKGVFPGVVSNHHLHHMAAKAVAFAEHLAFGEEYSDQIISNAQALGAALSERGIRVLGESKGYTGSHQILVDVGDYGGGARCAQLLEEAGIITNMNMIPRDDSPRDPSGLRFGTQEMTRLGMEEAQMDEVADLIHGALVDERDPEAVAKDAEALRADFETVHYCFDAGEHPAYKWWSLG